MTDILDTQQLAREELATCMVPAPEDLLDGLSPLAALFYAEQVAYKVSELWVVELSENPPDDAPGDTGTATALQAIGQAAGMLDAACIAVGILPDDAVQL